MVVNWPRHCEKEEDKEEEDKERLSGKNYCVSYYYYRVDMDSAGLG